MSDIAVSRRYHSNDSMPMSMSHRTEKAKIRNETNVHAQTDISWLEGLLTKSSREAVEWSGVGVGIKQALLTRIQ